MAMSWTRASVPLLRLAACSATVLGIAGFYGYVVHVRLATVVCTFLLPILFVSAAWGLRYAVFQCVISALACNYFFLPPVGFFAIDDPWDWVALFTFFVTGITASQLSERARRAALDAYQRRSEAEAAQQRFTDLVNSVEGIVWEADAETFVFTFVSDQAERTLGYPAEQWLREPTFWKDHLHPEDRDWAVRFCQEATAAKRPHDFEYRMIAADGRVVWFRDLVTVVVEGGRSIRLRGLMLDITRHKRNEATLREHADLLSLTHDAIFVYDMSNLVRYWNRGAEELYGWTAAEAVGKVAHDLLQTVFPVPLEQIEADVLVAGRWEGELIHTRKDGTKVLAASRWSLQRDHRGSPSAVLEMNNDITHRKLADEALRRQANLLEQSHDAIFVWEVPGTIVYWGRGAEQLYGFSRDEAVGRRSHDLLRTEHPMTGAEFEALLERDGAWSGELPQMTRDGRTIIVESRHVLMREADGRRLVLETNRDITDRKSAEEALQKTQAALMHATRVTTLGEVTASLAHELNQPLAAIVNNANACLGLLPSGRGESDEVRDALEDVISDAGRASAVIERVRALAKRSVPEQAPVRLADVVADVVALAAAEAMARRVVIRTDVPAGLPAVLGDPVQLQQVLLNLLVNAMDAMSGVEERERKLEIRGHLHEEEDGPAVTISVEDRGIGLRAGQADRLFEAFYTTKPHGMGLGLAISRSIIEIHGGRLWAEPNRGPGATFSFRLPSAKASAAA